MSNVNLQKVFEYEYSTGWSDEKGLYVHTLHTYYKGVNCWLYVERKLTPEHSDETKIINDTLESWKSGAQEPPKELFDESQHPMTNYKLKQTGDISSKTICMSLYEFSALVLKKPFDEIPKPLRSAFIKLYNDGSVSEEIGCETWDDESYVTVENYRIIKRAFSAIKADLKKHYGKDIDFYLFDMSHILPKESEVSHMTRKAWSKEIRD